MAVEASDAPLRVVIASEAARLGREHFDVLEDHGFQVVERYDLIVSPSEEMLSAALSDAWGLIAGGQRLSRSVIERSTLRVIARTGAGFDAIDVDAATSKGVTVFVTPSQNADGVADHTIALMLSTLRQVVRLDGVARAGDWRNGLGPSGDLHRAAVGIIGLGHIGRAVARRLSGFDCRVLACEPEPDLQFCAQLGIELLPLHEVLRRSDVLSLHVPLTPATRHLIGSAELALLPPHAVLINTSRGGTVDEAALVAALKSDRLGGSGIDVFESEPLLRNHPLTSLPNVVLTPHVASYSYGAIAKVAGAVVEGLRAASTGRVPVGSVNDVSEAMSEPRR